MRSGVLVFGLLFGFWAPAFSAIEKTEAWLAGLRACRAEQEHLHAQNLARYGQKERPDMPPRPAFPPEDYGHRSERYFDCSAKQKFDHYTFGCGHAVCRPCYQSRHPDMDAKVLYCAHKSCRKLISAIDCYNIFRRPIDEFIEAIRLSKTDLQARKKAGEMLAWYQSVYAMVSRAVVDRFGYDLNAAGVALREAQLHGVDEIVAGLCELIARRHMVPPAPISRPEDSAATRGSGAEAPAPRASHRGAGSSLKDADSSML